MNLSAHTGFLKSPCSQSKRVNLRAHMGACWEIRKRNATAFPYQSRRADQPELHNLHNPSASFNSRLWKRLLTGRELLGTGDERRITGELPGTVDFHIFGSNFQARVGEPSGTLKRTFRPDKWNFQAHLNKEARCS